MRKMSGRPEHKYDRRLLHERSASGKMLTSKAIILKEEVEANPRSRSARLRIFQKLQGGGRLNNEKGVVDGSFSFSFCFRSRFDFHCLAADGNF